ncbi:MAG: hypothetical protein J4F41_07745, partial [Alphaproteobacteria bacterium]|nr:hypothetical protein [Alphaproteobacteria bacterium]
HRLTLTPAEMTGIMSAIDEANGEMTGIPPARRSSMRQALKVMTAIINVLDPSGIVFSSYGVREGILYHELSNDIRRIHPLPPGVAEFAQKTQRYDGLGKSLSHQVMPFLGGLSESKKRLANACCYLADLTWLDHPDYRASLAIEKMLGLSIVGIDHYERAWMAAVLSVRYSGEFPGQSLLRGLLTRQEREEARLVGLVMRMLMSVSGGMPKLLDQITTKEKKKSVKITIPPALFGTETGLINRRITTIEKIGNLKVKVKLNAAD